MGNTEAKRLTTPTLLEMGRSYQQYRGKPYPQNLALQHEGRSTQLLRTLLVERYEQAHYAIPEADAVSVVRFLIEQQGVTQRDLTPEFGSESAVSMFLAGQRKLTLEEVRKLSSRFKLPAGIFIEDPSEGRRRSYLSAPPTLAVTRQPTVQNRLLVSKSVVRLPGRPENRSDAWCMPGPRHHYSQHNLKMMVRARRQRTMTSLGLDGSANFTPRCWLSCTVAATFSSAMGMERVHEPVVQ
jgi:antitoxin component HigA of HigAB toxin-antitoxin module